MKNDDLEKIERLHALKERGLLTAEEFAAEKRKLLEGVEETDSDDPVALVPTAAPPSIEEPALAAEDEWADWDGDESETSRRWTIWALGAGVLAVALAAAWWFLPLISSDRAAEATDPVQEVASPTIPTLTLGAVSESDFNGRDEVPHCSLSNPQGETVFISAILAEGERKAIMRIGGRFIELALDGAPNKFLSGDGAVSVLIDYAEPNVRSVGEDGVGFSGNINVTVDANVISEPFEAQCYAASFDQSWMGSVDTESVDASDIDMAPYGVTDAELRDPLPGKFAGGTLSVHRGTWAPDQRTCARAASPELLTIRQMNIKLSNEEGTLIQARSFDFGDQYTVSFKTGNEQWFRDYFIQEQTGQSFLLSTIAYNDPSGGGRRISMPDKKYVRCAQVGLRQIPKAISERRVDPINVIARKPSIASGSINSVSEFPAPVGARDQRFGKEVIVAFTVTTEGRARNCRITSATTDPETAARVCPLIIEKVRFNPALDENGVPVEAPYGYKQTFSKR